MTTEKVNAVKLFIFPFILLLKHCRNTFFNIKLFAEKVSSVIFARNKIFLFSLPFGDYDVDFWLETNSVKVNSINFPVFNDLRMISTFKKFYFILKFRFTPRFVVKK